MLKLRALRLLAELQSSCSDPFDFSADADLDLLLAMVMVAVDHGTVPMLGRAVLEGKLKGIPEPVCSNLIQAATLNHERNVRLQRELHKLVALANTLGYCPVLLKSTALLLAPRPHYLMDRLIGDLDILLPEAAIVPLVAALAVRGFERDQAGEVDSAALKHHPRLIATGWLAPIEIHRELAEVSWRDVLPGVTALAEAQCLPLPLKCAQLSPADRIVHAFIHDQLDNRGWWHARVELRGAHDAAQDLIQAGSALDWTRIEQQLTGTLARRLRIWLSWLAQLYPALVPVLPFPLRPEASRYASAVHRRHAVWRGIFADAHAELEQLLRSSAYRSRAWLRLRKLAAWRDRAGRFLARLRLARTENS